MTQQTFNLLVLAWIGLAIVLVPVQLAIAAPYGRHRRAGWGPEIGNRLGWIVMELVSICAFVAPGVVVAHGQPDRDHPDHEMAAENIAILKASKDARGLPLDVIVIDAPADRQDADGDPLSLSYINFYICNSGVVMCRFDDPQDAVVAELFARLFPGRKVVGVDAVRIFEGGGGVHCITQQQPAVG